MLTAPGVCYADGLWMPVDASQSTKGYCFIEFSSAAEAAAAQEQTDGYKLDKAHVFKVNPLCDFARFAAVPDNYVPAEAKAFEPRADMMSWLLDARGRDQFVVRFGDEAEVYWNDAHAKRPEEVYRRSYWTESYVQWSPRGNYCTTVHRQGIALWGGPSFARLARMMHPGVQFLEYSPGERFVATCSVTEPTNPRDATSVTVNFFDVRSGRKLRAFTGGLDDFMLPGAAAAAGRGVRAPLTDALLPSSRCSDAHPLLRRVSPGRCSSGLAAARTSTSPRLGRTQSASTRRAPAHARHPSVPLRLTRPPLAQTPDMTLLDKKSLKLEGVTDFAWSPSEPLLAVYQPEANAGNTPARVSLWSIPARKELRQKQLFNVSDAKMHWHPQGDYLCVRVDRFTKTKKTTYTGFELFRLKEKDYPMEVLELENKTEKIIAFAFEPNGHRFCIIHGEGARPDVSFYTMRADGGSKLKHLITLKSKSANAIFWSPQGRHLILAGLKGLNGQLEFFSADEMETLATAEHFMCTDVDWDPTGRYVATSVTAVHAMENGFNVWSFNGQLLYRLPRDRFFQFLWRPRPPTLLGAEAEKEIASNLKRYSKRYDEVDSSLAALADTAQVAERAALMDDWLAWLRVKRQAMDAEEYKASLVALVGPPKSAEEMQFSSETVEVEEVIDVNEEILVFGGQQGRAVQQ